MGFASVLSVARECSVSWLVRVGIGTQIVGAGALVLVAFDASAQAEYAEKIKLYETLQPTDDAPFGENINMFTGELSFLQTDAELTGRGPPIVLARGYEYSSIETLGRWSLTIPRIEVLVNAPGRFVLGEPGTNWQVETWPNGAQGEIVPSTARCTNFSLPYDPEDDLWMWWAGGYEFTTERGEKQQLQKRAPEYTAHPTILDPSGNPYNFPIVTQQNWQIGCLPNTTNNQEGEGFLAVSPDGTKYYLDYLVGVRSTDVAEPVPVGEHPIFHSRMAATMFVSRIVDRFGNTVTYSYEGDKLTSISADDGRSVSLVWKTDGTHRIESIKVQPGTVDERIWQYTYDQYGLTGVTLPDLSTWQFSLPNTPRPPVLNGGTCTDRNRPSTVGPQSTQSITTPSGLTGTFTISGTYHGRSYVPSFCAQQGGTGSETDFPIFGTGSVISKTLSGPGIPNQVWTYTYAPVTASTTQDACAQTNTCPDTTWIDISDPDGNRTRHTVVTRVGALEGKTTKVETFGGSSTLQRAQTFAYAPYNGGPYPVRFGYALDSQDIDERVGSWSPVSSLAIAQQGVTFSSVVNGFDTFARPLVTTKSSTLGYSRKEVTTYNDNSEKWVLGQVASVTCTEPVSTCSPASLVLSKTDYDPATALPIRTYGMGSKLTGTFTYNADGTLATSKNGNNHGATYSSWMRGIPRLVTYDNGHTKSATVDANGWIDSVTDESGATTSYAQDKMGRITTVTYPSGDTPTWAQTFVQFAPPSTAPDWLAAGHWRQTVSTGNARSETYFDAQWRPKLVREYDASNVSGTQRFQRFDYDHDGRTVYASYKSTTDAASTGVRTSYDALGRVIASSQDSVPSPLETITTYGSPFTTTTTNPRNQSTTVSYMAFDQPALELPVQFTLPESAATLINRDALGRPSSLVRQNANGTGAITRSYAYDSFGQVCRSTEPETLATLMGYDGAGNLSWSAAGLPIATPCDLTGTSAAVMARKVNRTYDTRNRITNLAFPVDHGINISYGYTPDGLLQTLVADNGDDNGLGNGNGTGNIVTTTYGYNHRRLPVSENLSWGSINWNIGYQYNTNGDLAVQTSPGISVAYAPNALGQSTQAGSYASSVQYHPNGAIKQFSYGNGISHSMQQNARQLPERSTDFGGANPLDMRYDYDANGNVTATTDYTVNGRQTRSMTYDGLDRLLTAQSVMFGGIASYTYDALDNIQSLNVAGRSYGYIYDANHRLGNITQGVGGSTIIGFGYDAQGNLENKNGQIYKFDFGNRLRSVTGKASYVYDGHGRRVRDFTTASKYSLYSQSGQLLYQSDTRLAKSTAYAYLGGSMVARVSTSSAPDIPSLNVPPDSTTGTYSVTWNSLPTATGYKLDELNGSSWTNVFDGNGTSKAFVGKAAGVYGYRIRACLNAGCSAWSATKSISVLLAPAGVPSIAALGQAPNGNYTVSWNSIATSTSYKLEESVNGGSWVVVYNGASLSQAYAAKPAGTYSYRVSACNSAGCGGLSAVQTAQAIYAPGGAPTPISPATNTTGTYSVTWSAVATSTSYQLEESANGAAWSLFYQGAGTSVSVSGKPNGAYSYRLTACNSVGCGPVSGTATTQVTHPPSTAPTISSPQYMETGNYSVNWTAVASATTYQMEESANGGGWTALVNGAVLSGAITGRPLGTYVYRVLACNAGGCGPYSTNTTTQVIAIPAMPATLTGYKVVAGDERPANYEFYVSWSSVAGATYYEAEETRPGSTIPISFSGPATTLTTQGKGIHTFRVRACNAVGCSAWKGPLSI